MCSVQLRLIFDISLFSVFIAYFRAYLISCLLSSHTVYVLYISHPYFITSLYLLCIFKYNRFLTKHRITLLQLSNEFHHFTFTLLSHSDDLLFVFNNALLYFITVFFFFCFKGHHKYFPANFTTCHLFFPHNVHRLYSLNIYCILVKCILLPSPLTVFFAF